MVSYWTLLGDAPFLMVHLQKNIFESMEAFHGVKYFTFFRISEKGKIIILMPTKL